ncbi:hypothetical protein GCM10009753_50250 [Streptantibioticus ferralitis]
MIRVSELTVQPLAAVAPKRTAVAPVNPVPVMVTPVPPAVDPDEGETELTVGAGPAKGEVAAEIGEFGLGFTAVSLRAGCAPIGWESRTGLQPRGAMGPARAGERDTPPGQVVPRALCTAAGPSAAWTPAQMPGPAT